MKDEPGDATRSPSPRGKESPEPLEGRRVVVTRSEEKSGELRAALERLGAEVIVLPVVRHAIARDLGPLAKAAGERSAFSHLVFTSQTAVRFFTEASRSLGIPVSAWAGLRVAAVGSKTASALREAGLEPVLVADRGAAGLARLLLKQEGVHRVLLPQSSAARPELREALQDAGVRVDAVPIYDTLQEDPSRAEPLLSLAFGERAPDAVIFASPSAIEGFLELAGERGQAVLSAKGLKIISIGPTTSDAVRKRGFGVAAEADHPTVEDLVHATASALSSACSGRASHRRK